MLLWVLAAGLLVADVAAVAAGCWCGVAAGYWLLTIGCWLLHAGSWLLPAGFSFLAAGFWVLALGPWLLAACWLVIGC